MFNCRWCFIIPLRWRFLIRLSSISDGAYVCNCLMMIVFWILNRRRVRGEENRDPKQLTTFLRCLLISFHSIHIQVIHVLCTWTKRNFTITGCDFSSFISSVDVCCLLMKQVKCHPQVTYTQSQTTLLDKNYCWEKSWKIKEEEENLNIGVNFQLSWTACAISFRLYTWSYHIFCSP